MNTCNRIECQTSAGCAHRGPNGEMCCFPSTKMALSDYSDTELSAELHHRMTRKIGDPRVSVTIPAVMPEYLRR